MRPITALHDAQLAAQARAGGLALTIWPFFFLYEAYAAGAIQLPLAGDELLLGELILAPTNERWLCAAYVICGDPAEPTRARWEGRQLALELRTQQFCWLFNGHVEACWGRCPIDTTRPPLEEMSIAVGVPTSHWYTTAT